MRVTLVPESGLQLPFFSAGVQVTVTFTVLVPDIDLECRVNGVRVCVCVCVVLRAFASICAGYYVQACICKHVLIIFPPSILYTMFTLLTNFALNNHIIRYQTTIISHEEGMVACKHQNQSPYI